MNRSPASGILVTTLLLTTTSPAAAQLDTLQVPMDLVVVLLGGQGRASTVFVGSPPPGVGESIPMEAAARVVGGRVMGSGGAVVVQVPGEAPEALQRYVDFVQAEGWERPTMPPDEQGGFQRTDPFGRDMWCGEDYWIRATSMTFDAKTYLRIQYTRRERGRDACGPPVGRGAMPARRPFGGLSFPVLLPPPGAMVDGVGSGSSNDRMDTGVTIESGMALESLFEHYAAQLTAAGWIPQGQAIGDGVSIGRWRVLDEDGNAVVGTLAIWALAEDELHRAWLRLDRASEAWPFDRP